MVIFCIDDEESMLRLLHKAVREAAPQARIYDHQLGSDALDAIAGGLRPDIVFCDIEMPRPTGLELALKLKSLSPQSRIVFVTGYSEYAVDAYRLHAQGYILKPVQAARIREELDLLPAAVPPVPDPSLPDRLKVQCFGFFEVYWKNEPLSFSRSKTRELFAFLIDRAGSTCQTEEIIAALFDDISQENIYKLKHNVRNLVNDLRQVLRGIGQEEVLLRKGKTTSIRPELLDCDYYRMMAGDMQALNQFRGLYMEQYSWAEVTKASLIFSGKGTEGPL